MADPLSIAGGVLGITSVLVATSDALLSTVREEHQDSVIVLSFRTLQAERIESLQQEIIKRTHDRREMQSNGSALQDRSERLNRANKELDETLHIYANAIRDYETFSQETILDGFDELNRFKKIIYLLFFPKKALKHLRDSQEKRRALADNEWATQKYNFRELNREIRLERERKKAFSERLWMGIFGGIAVVGPMLLMVLHRDLNTSIITASVATAFFAVLLALTGTNLAGKDILAATAAYAAVLVVFVGTSMAPIA